MRIQFKNVTLKNFLSFEYADITLDRNGYVQITGKNENPDDSAKSNGAGKSTITESIIWCLTGETIRGTKDVKRYNSEGSCEVTLEFSIDNNLYKIIRSKDPSNLFIYINGENKSGKGIRDTSQLLAEYLPDLTAQLIGSVIILGQGLPMRFSNNTPSGRKEVLEKLSKSDFMLEDLKARIQSRKSELSKKLRSVEDSILKNKSAIDLYSNQSTQIKSKLDGLLSTDISVVQSNLDAMIFDKSVKEKELSDILKERDEKLNEQAEINSQLSNLTSLEQNEITDNTKDIYASINSLNIDNAKYQAEARQLNNEILKLKNIKDTCPTCGQKIPNVIKPSTESQEESLKNLNVLIQKTMSDVQRLTNDAVTKKADISAKYVSKHGELSKLLTSVKNDIGNIERTNSSLTYSINKLTGDISGLTQYITNYNNNVTSLQDQLKDIDTNIKKLEDEVASYNTDNQEISHRIDIVNKMNNSITRDFRGFLLVNIINFIDKKAKEYSKIVFETDKIDFKLNGNNISISYCNKEYENLSGGERARCDIIIQLALRDMLCKYLNFSSNILVIDEIFDGLDELSCQKVLNLFSKKLDDVSTVYIISHHSDLSIPFDQELPVVKNAQGISYIAS